MPHPAAGARLPLRRVRRLRPLGRPARPREAHRPRPRGGQACPGSPVVVAGDGPDRERLEALADGVRPVPRPGLGGGARRPVRPLPRRLLRAGRRGLRDGSVRGVPRREAGGDDDRRGRARSRSSPTGETGLVCEPRAESIAAACEWLRGHVDEARRWGRAGARAGAARHLGCDDRRLLGHEGRLLLAAAAVALRDRRLLGAAPARARRARSTWSSPVPAGSAVTPKADVCLYHVGNDPHEHGWIVEALRRRPGVVVLHEFVLHHLVSGSTLARGDVDGYLRRARARRRAGRPPARPRRRRRPHRSALGDAPAGLPARRPRCSTSPPGWSSTPASSRASRAGAGYEGPIWRIPMAGLAGAERSSPRRSRADR